jgi:hypothetical protein
VEGLIHNPSLRSEDIRDLGTEEKTEEEARGSESIMGYTPTSEERK